MSKRNNQAKQKFGYKNDTEDLVELGQFLRESLNVRIEREWCVFYDRNETFLGVGKNMPEGRICRFKTPDLMVFNKKNNKLICCVELDGSVHDLHLGDTMDRNELYENLGIPLVVITKSTMGVSMFDDAYNKVQPLVEGNMNG